MHEDGVIDAVWLPGLPVEAKLESGRLDRQLVAEQLGHVAEAGGLELHPVRRLIHRRKRYLERAQMDGVGYVTA